MRERIFRVIFVGDNSDSCKACQSRLEAFNVEGVKGIEVFTTTAGSNRDVHEVLDRMNYHMPHIVLIEARDMKEEFVIANNLRDTLFTMQKFVLYFDRRIDKRIMQSLVINARKSGFDYFLADDAKDDEIAQLFNLVIEDFKYSLKAISPVKYLLEKTD